MVKPAITYNPKKRAYYIHNSASSSAMNTEGNMIKLEPNTKEQRALIKAMQRVLK